MAGDDSDIPFKYLTLRPNCVAADPDWEIDGQWTVSVGSDPVWLPSKPFAIGVRAGSERSIDPTDAVGGEEHRASKRITLQVEAGSVLPIGLKYSCVHRRILKCKCSGASAESAVKVDVPCILSYFWTYSVTLIGDFPERERLQDGLQDPSEQSGGLVTAEGSNAPEFALRDQGAAVLVRLPDTSLWSIPRPGAEELTVPPHLRKIRIKVGVVADHPLAGADRSKLSPDESRTADEVARFSPPQHHGRLVATLTLDLFLDDSSRQAVSKQYVSHHPDAAGSGVIGEFRVDRFVQTWNNIGEAQFAYVSDIRAVHPELALPDCQSVGFWRGGKSPRSIPATERGLFADVQRRTPAGLRSSRPRHEDAIEIAPREFLLLRAPTAVSLAEVDSLFRGCTPSENCPTGVAPSEFEQYYDALTYSWSADFCGDDGRPIVPPGLSTPKAGEFYCDHGDDNFALVWRAPDAGDALVRIRVGVRNRLASDEGDKESESYWSERSVARSGAWLRTDEIYVRTSKLVEQVTAIVGLLPGYSEKPDGIQNVVRPLFPRDDNGESKACADLQAKGPWKCTGHFKSKYRELVAQRGPRNAGRASPGRDSDELVWRFGAQKLDGGGRGQSFTEGLVGQWWVAPRAAAQVTKESTWVYPEGDSPFRPWGEAAARSAATWGEPGILNADDLIDRLRRLGGVVLASVLQWRFWVDARKRMQLTSVDLYKPEQQFPAGSWIASGTAGRRVIEDGTQWNIRVAVESSGMITLVHRSEVGRSLTELAKTQYVRNAPGVMAIQKFQLAHDELKLTFNTESEGNFSVEAAGAACKKGVLKGSPLVRPINAIALWAADAESPLAEVGRGPDATANSRASEWLYCTARIDCQYP
jgi:hypothetical protein